MINPTQSKDFVIVPIYCYELFKGIAMERINLQRKRKLKETDLNIVFWEESKTFFIQEYPEFVFLAQDSFYERSEIIPMLKRKGIEARHLQLMADYQETYTKERLELDNIISQLQEGILSLESLSLLKKEATPKQEIRNTTKPIEEESKSSDRKLSGRYKKPLFTFINGSTYFGEWVGDQPDGYGVKTYANCRRYEGDFRNGLKHGQGNMFWTDGSKFQGDTYEGDFKDDKMTGRGIYKWAHGEVYEGGWLEGKRHGLGWHKFANGSIYYSEYRNGKRNGLGVHLWKDGSKFDGDVYVGQFKDGLMEGEGTYFWADGRRYQGPWKGDKKHGEGVFTYAGKKERGLYEDSVKKQVLQTFD